MGATGAGTGAAAAAEDGPGSAEAGGGAGGSGGAGLSMPASNPESVILTNPAQPRRVKIDICLNLPQSPCRTKNDIYAGCYKKGMVHQEASESIPFGRHVQIPIEFIGILTSRAVDWYMYGSKWRGSRGGGVGGGAQKKFWTPLQNFSGTLARNFNISLKSSAQAQSMGTLFG